MLMKTPGEVLPPSLESLATVLRDPSMWPENFEWDFRCYSRCAMGLSQMLWGLDRAVRVWFEAGDYNRRRIFLQRKLDLRWGFLPVGYNRECVTPEDVARRIDRALGVG